MDTPTNPEQSPENLAALLHEYVAWDAFADSLRSRNRHFVSGTDSSYFTELVDGCLACRYTLAPEWKDLYRVRIMPVAQQTDTEPLSILDMGAPPSDRASEGRLNPEGIPYFYAALEPETAIAEVRPWPKARFTIAQFATRWSLDVLDLTGKFTAKHPSQTVRWVSFMMGRPVHRDDRWGYLGTQYLAERLKTEGVAGLLYDSAINPDGTNIALFSGAGLLGLKVELREVTSVSYASITLAQGS